MERWEQQDDPFAGMSPDMIGGPVPLQSVPAV
jgi:hypothetical protein